MTPNGAGMTLFDPLKLGRLTIRNRIMMSPMSQQAAGEDARATDWHLVHYGSRAVGGCGLVMVEDTAVAPLGRTSHSALGLYAREQVEGLRRIVSFCHAQGAAVGVQLAHAGRKALADARGAEGTVSASPVAFGPGWLAPREARQTELGELRSAFANATRLALEVGFDVVEVHAAHGYLLHQFLSPLTSFREDDYGGDGEARGRLLLEIVRSVRGEWPAERPLFVRLPAGDGQTEGLEIEEVAGYANACLAIGADLIDVTGGTPLLGGLRASDADVRALARELIGSPMALGGGITDGSSALGLLDEYGAALVSVGRPLLIDPYWPLRAAQDLGVTPPVAPAYAQALPASDGELSGPLGRAVSSPGRLK